MAMNEQDKHTTEADNDRALRKHLLYLLGDGGAHVDFEATIRDFPVEHINQKIEHIPYTPWQLLEHMRISQWDILEFSRNANHVSPAWPEGYWPAPGVVPDASHWQESIEAFRADLKAMKNLVADESVSLFAPLAHGDGETVLREALLVADHNAYHLGVLQTLKRILTAGGE